MPAPIREQTAVGSLLRHRHEFFFIIFLIFVVDLVKGLPLNRLSHPRFRIGHHVAWEGLPDHESVWRQPTSATKELQLEGRGSIYGTTDATPDAIGKNSQQQLTTNERVSQQTGWSTRSGEEVEALSTFKSCISGGNLAALSSWQTNDTTACAWAGVVCTLDKEHPHVTALNLRGRNLVGNITSALIALGHLGFLQRLDLSNNSFFGSISGASLSNFSRLSYLNVSYNQVRGAIPFEIGVLVSLETLALSVNNLTGQIPLSVGNCTSLRIIDLASNLLHGRIPQQIGRLSQLEILNLGSYIPQIVFGRGDTPSPRNSFSGSIPSVLSNCSLLKFLDLQNNRELGGELPSELAQLQHLRKIHLAICSFTGALPTWIGNYTSLTVLIMTFNQFRGRIPDEFGQLCNLTLLYLGANSLTGVIPTSLFNCTSLTGLTLEENLLSGIIPSQVGLLRRLDTLSLYSNEFNGVIPAALANCSFLRFLQLGNQFQTVPLMDPVPPLIAPDFIPSWMSSLSHLQYIFLVNMNLYGSIPVDIGRLYVLELLDLRQNSLTGPIPISLKNCTFLSHLRLNSNNLTGHIPSEIGLLKSMIGIALSDNSLTGFFPPSVANLTQLQGLEVQNNFLHGEVGEHWEMLFQLLVCNFSSNQFVGPIPGTLTNSSNLYIVDVSNNHLTGEIPPSFGNLSHIQGLFLSYNQIGGTIPLDLARCPLLETLFVRDNNLEGNISSDMDKLSSLYYLDLSHNKLTGIIPNSFQNFSNLRTLDLSYNLLSGSAPGQSLSKMPALTSLKLSHNHFSGSWPQQWSNLERIQEIDISGNKFSGPISNGTFKTSDSLVSLDLSRNKFSGPIPESLASLSFLVLFNASYNNFEGPIPTTGRFKSNITGASFLGNPGLCGGILGPSRECPLHKLNSNGTCKFFSCKKIWIPVCIGVLLAITVVVMVTGLVWRIRVRTGKDHQGNDGFDLFLSFGSGVRFEPPDILQIIQGGDDNVIGTGAKSVVYKGTIPGYDSIAIKTFPGYTAVEGVDVETAELWQRELVQEASNQAQLRHRNILKMLSFCSHSNFRALVLEYMPQGSLNDQLYSRSADRGERTCGLPWHARLSIVSDIAEGVTYLHHDCPEPIVHGDLKPSNILLGDDLIAKVADFGISKIEGETTASKIYGTVGYMPPEYAFQTTVSTKGDVYSYGILLLEVLTGRRPTSSSFGPEGDYRNWILEVFRQKPFDLLDPTLQEEAMAHSTKNKQMMLLMRVALFSTREMPNSRPSMEDLLCMLMQIRELGVEAVARRTIQELVNDSDNLPDSDGIRMWEYEEPNDTNLPSF